MSSLVWLFYKLLGIIKTVFRSFFAIDLPQIWLFRMHEGFTVNLRAEKMLTQAIHQYNKKCWIRLYTRVYFVQKSCNGAVVILYMQKCRQVKFIKILWAHTGYMYIMYKHLLRTFSITLNFDIKNSMYKILMVNGNENIQTKN